MPILTSGTSIALPFVQAHKIQPLQQLSLLNKRLHDYTNPLTSPTGSLKSETSSIGK